jgi:uncharacterized membrane protein YbhN (UPF0104 family)
VSTEVLLGRDADMLYPRDMPHHPSRIRRSLVAVAKIALTIALLGYLLNQAREHDTFTQLIEQPKRWPLLLAGLACTLLSITLTFARWHLFIRAVGISIGLLDTMRLGALGFALNFVSLGSIGGDLFKAIFLAHGQPGRRTEAVASVVADRVMGLLTMLVLASAGICAAGLFNRDSPLLAALCNAIVVAAGVALVGVCTAFLVPTLTGPSVIGWVHRLPIIGPTGARLLGAVATYRNQKRQLAAAAAISFGSNIANITAVYLMASGLPIERPTFREHLVIVPVANMVGAIPATPNGLGTKEAAVDLLYHTVPAKQQISEGIGTMVALAYRVAEMTVAALGLIYYLSRRREVSDVYHEAEDVAELE